MLRRAAAAGYSVSLRASAAGQQPVSQAQRRSPQRGAGRSGSFVQSPAGIGGVGLETFDVDVDPFASEQPFQLDDLDKGQVPAIALRKAGSVGGG